jgi:hypothetical protein
MAMNTIIKERLKILARIRMHVIIPDVPFGPREGISVMVESSEDELIVSALSKSLKLFARVDDCCRSGMMSALIRSKETLEKQQKLKI